MGRPGAGRKARARAGFPLPPWLWLPRPSEQTRPGAGRRAGRLPSAPGRRNLGPGAGHDGGGGRYRPEPAPLPCPGSPSRPGNSGRSQRLELTPEHTDSSPGRCLDPFPYALKGGCRGLGRWVGEDLGAPGLRGAQGRTQLKTRRAAFGAQGLGTAPLPAAHPPAAPPTSETASQSEPPGPPSSSITPPARPLVPSSYA